MKTEHGVDRHFRFPHIYVLLFFVITLAAALTWLLPAGEYARVTLPDGRVTIDAASYHSVAAARAGVMTVFEAVPRGLTDSAGLVFFVLVLGGTFQILMGTGALNRAIFRAASRLGHHEILIIPAFMILFSFAGATLGTTIEIVAFIPVAVLVAEQLGYDRLTGASMVVLGNSSGWIAGALNPWTTGIAQELAGLPLYSGLGLRALLHGTFLLVSCLYLIRYARRIKRPPEQDAAPAGGDLPLRTRDRAVLAIFIGILSWVVYGSTALGWSIAQMTPSFLLMGVAVGAAGGLPPNRIADLFVEGARSLLFGSLALGMARAILIVLSDGRVLDTIVFGVSGALRGLPRSLTLLGMFFTHMLMKAFIPSSSGQIAVTMPLMAPLADLTGLTRQCAVLAFNLGDGMTNLCNPTSAYLNSAMSIARVPFDEWLKFVMPLQGILAAISLAFLFAAQAMGYGPF